MSSAPPVLFDRAALALRRQRALAAPVDVLHQEAAAQVSERLLEINRSFTNPVIIGPRGDVWRQILTGDGALKTADMIDDDDVLDLDGDSTDLIIHALCLHSANDPVGQLVQARRALRPDGLMLAVMYGGRSLNELRSVLAEVEIAQHGGLSPRVFPMGELRELGSLLQRAGFALPVADSTCLTVTYADIWSLCRDLRGMAETNILTTRSGRPLTRRFMRQAQDLYTHSFPADGNRISATAELVFLTGWSPSPIQQQPLRPGSAQQRLADALGTTEQPVADPPPRIRDD